MQCKLASLKRWMEALLPMRRKAQHNALSDASVVGKGTLTIVRLGGKTTPSVGKAGHLAKRKPLAGLGLDSAELSKDQLQTILTRHRVREIK